MPTSKCAVLSDYHPEMILGGGGIIALEYFQLLKQRKRQTEFWTTVTRGSQHIHTLGEGIHARPVQHLRGRVISFVRQLLDPTALFWLVRAVRRSKIDVVWINQIGNEWPLLSILLFRLMGVRVIFTLHDYLLIDIYKISPHDPSASDIAVRKNVSYSSSFAQRLRRALAFFAAKKADCLITVGEIQTKILEQFGLTISACIPNGIWKCLCDTNDLDATEVKTILFAGRFQFKGLDVLAKAVSQTNGWRLIVAGDEACEEFCRTHLAPGQYRYLGRLSRTDLIKEIHGATLVGVLSQYFDPYPTVALESFCHGTPFITTNATGSISLVPGELRKSHILRVGEIPQLNIVLKDTVDHLQKYRSLGSSLPTPDQCLDLYMKYLFV